MKILNVNKFYFIKGGAERFYFNLTELLEGQGHEVVPFAMYHLKNLKTKYSKYFVSNIQTEKIIFNWQGLRTFARYFWSFEAARKIRKLIIQEKTEVAILHNIYHQISPSILPVLKKNKVKTILIAHDYGLLSPNHNMFVRGKVYDKICGHNFLRCIPEKCVNNSCVQSPVCSFETCFHHTFLNIYQKNIDFVICPSKFMMNMYIRAGWPKEKLIHLPYFINTNQTNLKNKTTTKDYVLYFGRVSQEKGINVLIEAMKDLPDINLKLVGDGPEKNSYELKIKKYNLENIEMLGYKSGDELNQIVADAKFIIVPSIWYENYPMSILESYEFGVPALVSNIGGLPEMIPGGNEQFVFTATDSKQLAGKIEFLWHNKDVLEQASHNVKQFVLKTNNPQNYYQKLFKLIKK